jgi:hypothetical protein
MDVTKLYAPTQQFSLMDYTASLVIVGLLVVILWALFKLDEIKEETNRKKSFREIEKFEK